uniref:CSON005263 protein n=1 Tax=Culicoides sonorensis TaxID=179676 RepID=A0A336LJ54_CULSO
MDIKGNTKLTPPSIRNVSCSHPRLTGNIIDNIGPNDTIQALFVIALTFLIIIANLTVIIVINSRRYASYLHPQALLRGALLQQSAVILVCMAVDRYMCALHPKRYHLHSSKKGCVAILSVTWILCLTFFSVLVLPKGYYFNSTGLLACEPFYSKPSYRILSSCAFYFPTTMVLMYCYGSSFHANRRRFVTPTSTVSLPVDEKQKELEPHSSGSTSRTMAAISLGFIVIVTPWTILEIVTACTGSKVPSYLDFTITWLALSNSFWNPFLYWLLNAHFRRICMDFLHSKCLYTDTNNHIKCYNDDFECDNMIALPLPPKPPNRLRSDIEGLSEKYWGEILERAVSSNSLHALQRTYGDSHSNHRLFHDCTTTSSDIDSISGKIDDSNHLGYLSSSEPRLCEHDLHDVNCAKNRAFFGTISRTDDNM